MKREEFAPKIEQYNEARKTLQANDQGVVTENGKEEFAPKIEQYNEARKTLQANDQGVVTENGKCVARLSSQEEALSKAHLVIKPKKSITNLSQVNSET
ncbi:4413_t:CDS:2 [Entrophospora sp. SA101]|nr:4413_t:CDS:2 [Entrophospora sp. SA101]CAJ0838203.1 1776_t:CDS:2 [Entrophospora sp. SA101]